MTRRIISIPKPKAHQLKEFMWYSDEEIIIAVPADIQIDEKESEFSGIFAVSYGGYYIFKMSMFGSPELVKEVAFLKCGDITTKKGKLTLMLEKGKMEVKVADAETVCKRIVSMYIELTYKIKNPPKLKVKSETKLHNPLPKERPMNLFLHRIICLSHYFDEKSELYSNYNYFDFQSDSGTDMLIEPKFDCGPMTQTFGTFIGWENRFESLYLQVYNAPNIMDLLNAIFSSAQKMNRIVFSDYKETQIPNFDFSKTKPTNINRFSFLRTCGKMIVNFLIQAADYPTPIEEIGISVCTMRPQEFGEIITNISLSPSARKLKKFAMNRVVMKPFPFDDITRLFTCAPDLETIILRGLDIDASYILRYLFEAKSNVKQINLRALVFKTELPKGISVPESLISLNISQCTFYSNVFKSFIEVLTNKLLPAPILLSAQSLVMKDDIYSGLSGLNFESLAPNLCEIDFSGNGFAFSSMKYFFAFLCTQSRMHLLALNDVYTDNTVAFLSSVSTLVRERNLCGLEISGRFVDAAFAHFITTLSAGKELRHVKLQGKLQCEYSLAACRTLIEELPNLVEFGADSFKPRTPQPFLDLWIAVSKLKSLKAVEMPVEDMSELGLSISRMSEDVKPFFDILKKKAKMSITGKRIQCMIDKPSCIKRVPVDKIDITSDDIDEKMAPYVNKDIFINSSLITSWTDKGEDEKVEPTSKKTPSN